MVGYETGEDTRIGVTINTTQINHSPFIYFHIKSDATVPEGIMMRSLKHHSQKNENFSW